MPNFGSGKSALFLVRLFPTSSRHDTVATLLCGDSVMRSHGDVSKLHLHSYEAAGWYEDGLAV